MTELEVDKSHLPGVQGVCDVFAVLEDGALAHNLQEQEIEQYYTTNIQKNRLVQNDIRIAKRLQDEEEEQRARHRALLSQAARRLEEQDSEYARKIQEEVQRRADEEARRRESEDQEIAKRIQEEEEERAREGSLESVCAGTPDSVALRTAGQNNRRLSSRNRHSPPLSPRNGLPCPPSGYLSDEDTDTVFLEHLPPRRPSRLVEGSDVAPSARLSVATSAQLSVAPSARLSVAPSAQLSVAPSAQLSVAPSAQLSVAPSAQLSVAPSAQLSVAPSAQLSVAPSAQLSVAPSARLSVAPSARLSVAPSAQLSMAPSARLSVAPTHQPQERRYRSLGSSSFRAERNLPGDRGEKDDRRRSRQVNENRGTRAEMERVPGSDRRHSSSCTSNSAAVVRERDRVRRSLTYREPSDKQVRFQDDASRHCHSYHGDRKQSVNVWQLIARDLKERGMSVRQNFYGGSLPQGLKGELRDSQLYSTEGDAQHQRAFQRAVSTRRSYHGDVRERRASLSQAYGGSGYRGDGQRVPESLTAEEATGNGLDVYHRRSQSRGESGPREREVSRGESGPREREVSRGESGPREREVSRGHRYHTSQSNVTRSVSERCRGRKQHQEEAEQSTSEEDMGGREERSPPPRRVPQRSQSFCSRGPSITARSRHTPRAAGAARQSEEGVSLNLGALQQVLLDEELARRLQEEENMLLGRAPPACPPLPHDSYTREDFTAAQVAQDEEIAHFMQKQEMKAKRRSCDHDDPGSWRDKDLAEASDRRTAREKECSSLRERMDSEGLKSPTEECFPDNQDPALSQQPLRNIAEELDPTFKARRQGNENIRAGNTLVSGLSSCQSNPAPNCGLHESTGEPTFVPPTKRQSDKSGHGKSKEKRENCKHQ
ncbi:hypothetical protein DPEC_G00010770 [Dallia pectoralis]|uniref:Uncharacterized protein n=1 Tax=Dallia pectoralis TaxID=75939 RepID=A0ACC2HL51_DALPE|nr:hypothetical protein DPEC_G00010770 [Dallia pectoralis]